MLKNICLSVPCLKTVRLSRRLLPLSLQRVFESWVSVAKILFGSLRQPLVAISVLPLLVFPPTIHHLSANSGKAEDERA